MSNKQCYGVSLTWRWGRRRAPPPPYLHPPCAHPPAHALAAELHASSSLRSPVCPDIYKIRTTSHQWYHTSVVSYISDIIHQWHHTSVISYISDIIHQCYHTSVISYITSVISYISDIIHQWHQWYHTSVTSVISYISDISDIIHQWYHTSVISYNISAWWSSSSFNTTLLPQSVTLPYRATRERRVQHIDIEADIARRVPDDLMHSSQHPRHTQLLELLDINLCDTLLNRPAHTATHTHSIHCKRTVELL
jgi:hypothetical protein